MKNLLFIILAGVVCSCKNIQKQEIDIENQKLSKLELLKQHRPDIPLDSVDLSNENLSEIPYLGNYTIKYLDLSHNNIEKLTFSFLPKGLKKLDISNNSLSSVFMVDNMIFPTDEIVLSHNQINFAKILSPIRKLQISHNELEELYVETKKMEYLDVSHNLNFNNVVWFNPEKIDTILYDFTLNNKPLIIKPIPMGQIFD